VQHGRSGSSKRRPDRRPRRAGRHYKLGRRIQPEDVPGEGEEAWISFDLLIGADAADGDAVPPISADPGRDARWVTACKMARHLDLTAPSHAPADVEAFSCGTWLRIRPQLSGRQ